MELLEADDDSPHGKVFERQQVENARNEHDVESFILQEVLEKRLLLVSWHPFQDLITHTWYLFCRSTW